MTLVHVQNEHASKILVNLLINEGTSKILKLVSIMAFRKGKRKRKGKEEKRKGYSKRGAYYIILTLRLSPKEN